MCYLIYKYSLIFQISFWSDSVLVNVLCLVLILLNILKFFSGLVYDLFCWMFHVHLKICEFCCWMECCINNNLVRLVDSSFQIFYMLTSLFKFRKYLTIISKYVRFPSLMLPHFFRYFSCIYVRPLNIVTQATEAWLVSNFLTFFSAILWFG